MQIAINHIYYTFLLLLFIFLQDSYYCSIFQMAEVSRAKLENYRWPLIQESSEKEKDFCLSRTPISLPLTISLFFKHRAKK